MYYICEEKQQDSSTVYGVIDTKDNIIEYYNVEQLLLMRLVHNIEIVGFEYKPYSTPNYKITIIEKESIVKERILELLNSKKSNFHSYKDILDKLPYFAKIKFLYRTCNGTSDFEIVKRSLLTYSCSHYIKGSFGGEVDINDLIKFIKLNIHKTIISVKVEYQSGYGVY